MSQTIPSDYFGIAADLESNNGKNTYNPTTGATGIYQFLPSTWKSGGYAGSISDPAAQQAAMEQLTQGNASVLASHGIPITDTSLYSAHVLGASGASRILSADPSTPLSSLMSKAGIKANPFLGTTAGSAVAALAAKVSAAGNGSASLATNALSAIAGEANSIGSGAASAIGSAVGFVTSPVQSVIQQIQAWLVNSAFFTRLALAVVAIIVLVAAFAMFKPVQDVAASGAKLAAA